jgi:hypothetical protein
MENTMSAISAGGLNPNILQQYLQSLNQSQQTGPTSGLAGILQSQRDSNNSTQGVAGGHKHQHGDSGKFFQSVQSAVNSALQTAQSGGASAGTPNQLIQNAILQMLKNSQSSGTTSAGQPDSTAGVPTADSAFAQMLQSNGVNAGQFQQNFLSAVQSAQNGQSTDPSTIFAGFPSGSLINTLA